MLHVVTVVSIPSRTLDSNECPSCFLTVMCLIYTQACNVCVFFSGFGDCVCLEESVSVS